MKQFMVCLFFSLTGVEGGILVYYEAIHGLFVFFFNWGGGGDSRIL